jgi:hypothetical protein
MVKKLANLKLLDNNPTPPQLLPRIDSSSSTLQSVIRDMVSKTKKYSHTLLIKL